MPTCSTPSTRSCAAAAGTARAGASIDHRVNTEHACDERCRPHRCKPMSASSIRHMHFILSGAYKRAVRWRWVSASPVGQAEPPAAPTPNPKPPTSTQAAQIVNEAWKDAEWGTLVWIAMTTGARRGELCAVRWSAVDLQDGRETLWLHRAIGRSDAGWAEGDLKTHQQRRIALDAETAAVLREHRAMWDGAGRRVGAGARRRRATCSPTRPTVPPPSPAGVSQRYERLVDRLESRRRFTSSAITRRLN